MSRRRIDRAVRSIVAIATLGALLAGCADPDLYYDRRETVALGAEDAVASNMITQMVDPWPRHSNNNNLAFNGERMQRAVECYRVDKVTPPADLNPSTSSDTGAAPSTGGACEGRMTSGSAAPAMGTILGGTATPTSTASK